MTGVGARRELTTAAPALRVLLLEDERSVALIVAEHLRAVEGVACAITFTETLGAALERLASQPFDLVIADLNVPDSAGVLTINALVKACGQPVIALTGDPDRELRAAVLACGAYDFLAKGRLNEGALPQLVRLAALQARTLASLRESEQRFRDLTALSSDWYWEQDAELRLTFMSQLVGEKMGINAADYLGRRRWEQPALNLSEADWAAHRANLERRQPFHDFEMQRPLADGSSRWLSVSGEPVFDGDGNFRGYRGVGRDITRQKRAEQALRESEARFRSLVELSSDFYWETDAEHRLTHSTHDAKHRPASEPIIGKRRWEMPSILPDEAGWAAHRATLAARRPFRDFEIARVDPDGVRRHLWISGEPVFAPSGEFLGYRGLGRDVSEQRREERLVELEHAVARDLADAKDVRGALLAVMRAVCESEGWDAARFFRLDPEADVMRCEEVWASGAGPLARFAEESRGTLRLRGFGLVAHVWESGEPVWIADVSQDPRLGSVERVREMGMHGAFIFPVAFEGRVLGVLSISSSTVRRPDERLMQTLRVIGAQVGQFLQRNQAEAALSESEQRFRQTFELAGSGIAHVSLTGRFLRANRRLCEMLGYTAEELLAQSVKDLSHPEDGDATEDERARMLAGEAGTAHVEKRYVRKDGAVVWIDLTIALVRNAQGEPQYEIAVMDDITERKEKEAALQRFRTALDSAADMVLLFDVATGRLLDFNETACTDLGYERDELLRLTGKDIRVGVTQDMLRVETAELIRAGGRRNTLVTEYRRKDGSTLPVESRRSVIDTPQGRVLLIASRDLTERTRAEKRRAAQVRYQKKISRLGQAALSKRDPAELVAKAVQSVLEGLGGGAVAYFERGDDAREMALRRASGVEWNGAPLTLRIGRDDPLAPLLERSESVMLAAPWRGAPALPAAWLARFAAAAFVAVPGAEGPRGVLCALGEAPGGFGPEETRFLGAAASMMST
ncbi:MAG TPA: PAS domain S-box protein, partial [Burkholderiales bacterium]|nr:PAS domain S-box protein [Burkholderiales bacterium]